MQSHAIHQNIGGDIMKDPSGMQVDEKGGATSQYNEQTYYFCALSCKQKFDKAPMQHIKIAWYARGSGFTTPDCNREQRVLPGRSLGHGGRVARRETLSTSAAESVRQQDSSVFPRPQYK
jgi:YHS domain-containing protein